jgi:hypothetical protein
MRSGLQRSWRRDRAGELSNHAVAGAVEHVAVVLGDQAVNDPLELVECLKRPSSSSPIRRL